MYILFFHDIQSYKRVFIGKINGIHILINEKLNWEIPEFFKTSRDTSRPKIEPGSRELNTDCMCHEQLLLTTRTN